MAEGPFLLDSNICIYLLQNASPALTGRVADQPIGSLFISAVTLAEISVGYGGNIFDAHDLQAMLEDIPVLDFGVDAACIYGALPFRRARFDRLIAAHALSLKAVIVTSNEADFADIPDLRTENWTV
jgi:tRNA(fMet)-specific endonuclease VapC